MIHVTGAEGCWYSKAVVSHFIYNAFFEDSCSAKSLAPQQILFQFCEWAIVAQFVARCKEDILKAKGVKPTLSPNLKTLATVEALNVKRLLFIGVGCQVLACLLALFRSVQSTKDALFNWKKCRLISQACVHVCTWSALRRGKLLLSQAAK